MSAKQNIQNGKSTNVHPDLELAFDVGHSSIGWAVLQTIPSLPINILGCGVVTFGADDCLASKRRDYRRQRRHVRATRQRIAQMETLLAHLGVISKAELIRLHSQAKGHSKQNPHEQRGASAPWLLAARVLAASTDEERKKAELNWPQLWDVLRWYAHNRGYDGNIRWSGGFRIEAMSDIPQVSGAELERQAKDAKESKQDTEEDWKKLEAAAQRMADYGFTSPTFAEMVAKFLLGPNRTVEAAAQGKPGVVQPTAEKFTEEQFRRLLFNCDPGYENHPRHLSNYFKGLRAAFPRRVIKTIAGKPTLVAGTEWEVRKLLHAHFGHLSHCDATFEQTVCGGIPEQISDWRAYEQTIPALYLSAPEKGQLKKLRISRKLPREEKERLREQRKAAFGNKLLLPDRYHGGLLFGQLVPRFDNRIIAQCPITFAEEYQRFIQEGCSAQDAKHKASDLAKVPGKNCVEFLDFRWAMTLANIRIGHGSETYRDRDGKEVKLRPLIAEERRKVDACVRRLGFLKVDPDKQGKDGHMREGKNELRQIVTDETKCNRHNLDTLLLHPDAKDGLELLPLDGDMTAFRIGWACFDDPTHDADGFYQDSALRRRFTIQLLRQKKLSLAKMIQQLEKIGHGAVASRIREAAAKKASGEKLEKLMAIEFFCPKLKGRARFSRVKLRQAFQEVFRKEKPLHPLETGGCLEQTEAIKQAAVEQDLAELTNNHLVRHRLLILAGDEKAKPKPKEGLLQHLIQDKDFANGDKCRIARITVELARDLQQMSGMTNKEKSKEMFAKLAHHEEVSADLAKELRDTNGNPLRDANGRPFAASPGMIRKARILADLARNPSKMKQCPYTGHTIEFNNLATPHLQFGTADKDHIIPRSQRLSDALEAQVITFSEINRLKGQRTALQFIKDMNKPENRHHKERFGIRTEAQFRAFRDSLWPLKDPFKRARAGGEKASDDEARCWRRKELLMKESWDGKEFTPADLAKTRHIVKLAAQKLEGGFSDLLKEERPPVIAITGAVTASFRDKSWKLLGELAAVNPAVKEVLAKGAQEWEAGKDFNPKKAVREITHLHHALDSIALGLVTSMLVPPRHQSLNGAIARFIVKGKLTVDKERGIDEVSAFRELCAKLGLPPFVRLDSKNRLHIDELAESLKTQIRTRLAEKRVVQHIPADMSGLKVDQTYYRAVFDRNEVSRVPQRIRRRLEAKKRLIKILTLRLNRLSTKTDQAELVKSIESHHEELQWWLNSEKSAWVLHRVRWSSDAGQKLIETLKKYRGYIRGIVETKRPPQKPNLIWPLGATGQSSFLVYELLPHEKLLGVQPKQPEASKLTPQKSVMTFSDNFGVAILDHSTDPDDKFAIVPWHKVWHRLEELKQKNLDTKGIAIAPRVLRIGKLIQVPNPRNKEYAGLWMIRGAQLNQRDGYLVDISRPDTIDTRKYGKLNVRLESLVEGGLEILKSSLCGVAQQSPGVV